GAAPSRRSKRMVKLARSMSKASTAVFSAAGISTLLFSFQMGVEVIEPSLPLRTERLDPVGNRLHRQRREASGAALRVPAPLDQACALEHLEVLGDGRLAERKRRHQLRDARLAAREPDNDGAPRGVTQRVEGSVQMVRRQALHFHMDI